MRIRQSAGHSASPPASLTALAIAVMSEIAGADYAQGIQLALEYAPEPPLDCGRPELARPEILAAVQARLDSRGAARTAAVRRAAARLPR